MQIAFAVPSGTPFDYEAITVGTSVESLTSSKYIPTGSAAVRDLGNARFALVTVEGSIRFRADGTDPTATEGHLVTDSDFVLPTFAWLKSFRAIRDTSAGADATIRVTYVR